jgi:hypothetical protein
MQKGIYLLIVLISSTAFAQGRTGVCILDSAKNAQIITVRGKVANEPHDMEFRIPDCDELVLLTYAGDGDNEVSGDQLQRDESLRQFQKYTSSTYRSRGKSVCIECMKYGDVEATLTGKLEIATVPPGTTKDALGFLHDPSGKIVGKAGWGHPVPFAKYRLVIESVSDVAAKKLPKPNTKPTGTTWQTDGLSRTTATSTPTTPLFPTSS